MELPSGVGALRRLRTLDLTGCERLRALPYALCDIAEFQAPLLYGIPALTELLIDVEFMQSPPPIVVAEGIQAIYDFLNLNRVASETGFFEFVNKSLVELPASLYTSEMSGVTDLNLSGNCIAQLPDLVSSLGNLLIINLDDNALNTLPSGVAGLTSLTRLSLKGNPLRSLPPELGCIHALRTLELDPKARLFPSTLRRLTRTHPPSPARRPPPGRSRARDGGGRAQVELTVPPPEVSRKGGAAVLAYFRRMADARLTGRMEAARLQLVALPQVAPTTFVTPVRPLRCPPVLAQRAPVAARRRARPRGAGAGRSCCRWRRRA